MVIKKHLRSGPSLVYMTCCRRSYEQMGKYGDWSSKCIIYTKLHKLKDYLCRVAGCHKGKRKASINIKVKFANSRGGYPINSYSCTQKHKVEADAQKNKLLSQGKAKINGVSLSSSKVNFELKANSKPKASLERKIRPKPKTSPSLDKTNSGRDKVTSKPNMRKELVPKWVKYKKDYNFDQDVIPKGINYSEKFQCQ